jgi:hypothetical protein
MCLSVPYSLPLISSANSLVILNPIAPDSKSSFAPPDLLDVPAYPHSSNSALAFDFAVGEVVWLGVPGPS